VRQLLVLVAFASIARAEPRANAVYLETFGKCGLWGVGFDRRVHERVRAGGVGAGGSFGDQRYIAASAYVGTDLLHWGRNAWFVDGGALFAHTWIVSPVPEWEGTSATGVAANVSSGFEYRGLVLARVFVHAALGKGGVLPWAGADIGFTF
jgi:hypothetical protein